METPGIFYIFHSSYKVSLIFCIALLNDSQNIKVITGKNASIRQLLIEFLCYQKINYKFENAKIYGLLLFNEYLTQFTANNINPMHLFKTEFRIKVKVWEFA
jgi:hypothetical protein